MKKVIDENNCKTFLQLYKVGTVVCEMSGGGHFKSYWISRKTPKYYPNIVKLGATNLNPFLEQSNLPDTEKSKDPLLVSKPVTKKEENVVHESDRIIHTRSVINFIST